MNPPPALFGAMSRERKPFTYTPGGLDLSEIKSERMAQRLMRNAMNQGVPETPANSVRSPPASGIPTGIPNFNCLPVQVFPTFHLPANPKSLLRTRSNPDGSKEIQKPIRQLNENLETNVNKQDKNRFSYPNGHESLDTKSLNPYENAPSNFSILPKTNINSITKGSTIYESPVNSEKANKFVNNDRENNETVKQESNVPVYENTEYISRKTLDHISIKSKEDSNKSENYTDVTLDTKKEQEETTVTKSSTKIENDVQTQNGDTETAVVVKLPTKKSAAKTETKVEVVQKTLPDGSVQEIKTTTTQTTIDGKTEISTKTETKTISKEETDEETYEEEEEIEEENVKTSTSNNTSTGNESIKQNGEIIKQEEKSETSTTKKVVVIQSETQESEEENEEVEEEVEEEEEEVDQNIEEVIVIKKQDSTKSISNNLEEKQNEVEILSKKDDAAQDNENENNQSEEECENEENEAEESDKEVIEIESKDKDLDGEEKKESEEKNETIEVENKEVESKEPVNLDENKNKIDTDVVEEDKTVTGTNNESETIKDEVKSEEIIIPIQTEVKSNEKIRTEILKEPAVPLEKVEEVEIKPIGAPSQEVITKSHKEIITTTTDKPSALSTQTEYNVVENIVTVNRTTKTLDHAYEQAGEYTIPVVKTSLIPDNSAILPPPPPVFNRTYQTTYSTEPTTERRHSLLLERLSVERQLPTSNIYQTDNTYINNTYDARQISGEPQSEIVIENNVKPSMLNKNQHWYARKDSYDYATTGSSVPSQQWNQQQSQPQTQCQPQVQPQYQSQPQSQYQPQSQHQPQTQFQSQPQPQYQPQTQFQSQPQYQPQTQTQYQSQYEYTPQSHSYQQTINQQTQYSPQPQSQPAFNETYKSSIQNNYSQNTYSSYTPKPSWVNSTLDPKPTSLSNQYAYESESYQKSTQNQNSYVPPPWEQDSGYTNNSQSTYQPQTPSTPLPKPTQSWKVPTSNVPKPTTSYIPPAPNQSFVKPVSTDPPRMAGRKTYYSEYERRYITVPESTYIPTETKFQAQPDPSPKYYYDQNDTVETVEPQWRKELREFTEKTQTSSHTTETSVRPPWEDEPKYVTSEQTNTRTWSQTLRPRSFRERSIESDYTTTTKEWSKSNSLGRGRPQSSYVNNLKRIPERPRGVSVDRYNPNIYTSPLMGEHPPVQSQTLDPALHPKPHYNPNVPAYHSRASAEPTEQPAYSQPKWDSRAPPVQSRSFKYLQWITGTED